MELSIIVTFIVAIIATAMIARYFIHNIFGDND
jgi:hypothetical protein